MGQDHPFDVHEFGPDTDVANLAPRTPPPMPNPDEDPIAFIHHEGVRLAAAVRRIEGSLGRGRDPDSLEQMIERAWQLYIAPKYRRIKGSPRRTFTEAFVGEYMRENE